MSSCAAGGAMNVGNFRESLSSGRLPAVSTVTHGGLFREYYFPIGPQTTKVFDANLHAAVSPDPFSNKPEYFVSIGLNSKFDGEGLAKSGGRPSLNLLVLIDVSGSMGSPISYSDKNKQTKLDLAKDSCKTILTLLKPTDRLSLLTFDANTKVIQPFAQISSLDMGKVRTVIDGLKQSGSTELSKALSDSGAQFDICKIDTTDLAYENRILVLTDAEPTSGDCSEDGLLKILRGCASRRIFSSILGMGVDFGSDLVEGISRVPGGLYMTVNTNSEFVKTMNDDFDYLMTPIVHNFLVEFAPNSNYKLLRVFGDSMNEENQGINATIMQGSSMMPSDFNEVTGTKGGVVLLKLDVLTKDHPFQLRLRYEDRKREKYDELATLDTSTLPTTETFQSLGVRKAVLLTRYVNFIQTILAALHEKKPCPDMSAGIPTPPPLSSENSKHKGGRGGSEQGKIDDNYAALIKRFVTYFEGEVDQIGDSELTKELKLLDTILKFK